MHRAARVFLVIVSILNGAAGLVCGVLFIIAPDGRLLQAGELLPIIGELPLADVFFQDFFWIGIAMLLVLGIPNTAAAVMLLRRDESQYKVTLASALLLLAWTGFELVFMINGLAVGYFVVGIFSAIASVQLLRAASPTSA